MTLLQLPLRLSPTGFLRECAVDDQEIGKRLRVFLMLAMGEYDRVGRTPRTGRTANGGPGARQADDPAKRRVRELGMKALWEDLGRMGGSSRFRFLYTETLLGELRKSITDQVNAFLEGIAVVVRTSVLGDENVENAVVFETRTMVYTFEFSFAGPAMGRQGVIGSWRITERFDAKP